MKTVVSERMKSRLVRGIRLLVAVAALVLYVYGYVCYERTLVEWWCPVAAAAAVALFTALPLSGCWRWLTGTAGRLNQLCHLYVVGGVCYFLLLAGNCHLPADDAPREEEAMLLKKEVVVRNIVHRAGRQYRTIERNVRRYYLHVRLADGREKRLHVSIDAYNRVRQGAPCFLSVRQGFWGFPVVLPDGVSSASRTNRLHPA